VAVGGVLIIAANSDFLGMLRRGFDVRFLWAALTVQPVILLGMAVYSVRHVILIGAPRVPFNKAFKAVALSQGLNLMLPGRLSEVLKGTYLRDHAAVPLSAGMSAVVLERTVDLLIVSALGVVGLALFVSGVDYRTVAVLSAVSVAVILFALHAKRPTLRVVRALPWPRVAAFVERAYLHFSATVRTGAFFKALALGVVGWGISYANIFAFMEIGGSIPVGASGVLLVFVFTTFGAAVPALPGGIGTYEAAGVVALRSLGYPFDEALAITVALHAAQLILPFLLAMAVMLTERVGLSSLISELRASTLPPSV
jgi:uncharacterized membrane protein YbhN (UPF0104 family)